MEKIELYDMADEKVVTKTQQQWLETAQDLENEQEEPIEINNAGEAIELLCDLYNYSEQVPDSTGEVETTVNAQGDKVTELNNGDTLIAYKDGMKVMRPVMVGNSVITQEIEISNDEYEKMLKG